MSFFHKRDHTLSNGPWVRSIQSTCNVAAVFGSGVASPKHRDRLYPGRQKHGIMVEEHAASRGRSGAVTEVR